MRALHSARIKAAVCKLCTGIQPYSTSILPSARDHLITSLKTCKSIQEARILHNHALFHGYENDIFLSNRLLQVYGNFGSLQDAETLMYRQNVNPNLYSWNIMINVYSENGMMKKAWDIFDDIPCRDVVTWNSMMSSCVKHGRHHDALCLFWSMHHDGISYNDITFVNALDACSLDRDCEHHHYHGIRKGYEIHGFASCLGFDDDVMVGNALITFYGIKYGDVYGASWVFSHMPQRDVVSWTSMMSSYTRSGDGEESLHLFYLMHCNTGMKPDKVAYICALDACANVFALDDGRVIHALIGENLVADLGVVLSTALVNMYGECDRIDDSKYVFSRMSKRNIVCWTAMLSAFSKNGHGREALQLFYRMKTDGIDPNNITFAFAIDACTIVLSLSEGQKIHGDIVKKGHEKDTAVSTSLVNLYGNCHCMNEARFIFYQMQEKSVVSWSNMITTCTQNGSPKEALNIFHGMQECGVKPNVITFICLMDACSSLTSLHDGRAIDMCIDESGLGGDVMLGNALMSMYGKCGSFQDAERVFHRLSDQTVVSWTALVSSFAQSGHGADALAYLHQMMLEGIIPDSIVLTSVLSACSHSGLIDEAKCILCETMNGDCVSQTMDHFFCMVDILARPGQLDEAETLLWKIPFQNLTLPWLSLLGACRNHGDVERGIYAATCCFEQDPHHSSAYTMLGNVFATDTMFENEEIRLFF